MPEPENKTDLQRPTTPPNHITNPNADTAAIRLTNSIMIGIPSTELDATVKLFKAVQELVAEIPNAQARMTSG